jgi:hypothetical protein
VEIATAPNPSKISYSRATHLLTVGTLTIDTTKTNVAVLSTEPNGVAVLYQRELDLAFAREHRAQAVTGVSLLDAQPEIVEEVRKLLERMPELQHLVRGDAANGASGD